MGIIRVTIWIIGDINLLAKSPGPPSIRFLVIVHLSSESFFPHTRHNCTNPGDQHGAALGGARRS